MDNINYYEKYNKYKKKYIKLQNIKIQNGGKRNIFNYRSNVLLDLSKIYKTITKRKKLKNNTSINDRVFSRTKSQSKPQIDVNKIYKMTKVKYSFDKNYELKEKYLEQYKYYIKNFILSLDLYNSGFYEHQFKLKQYLSECGTNRTTQLFGTCWFNTVMNGFIFGENLRGRMVQLLLYYKNIHGNDILDNIMKNIDKTKYKLNLVTKGISINITKEKYKELNNNIFYHILGIFYKVLCNEGLRNTKRLIYDNFNLTNLAASIKILGTRKSVNINKIKEIAYSPIYGFDILIDILNIFIDTKPHFYYKDKKIFNFNNNHINRLFFSLNNDPLKSTVYISLFYPINFKNIDLEISDNGIKEYLTFNGSAELESIENFDFIFLDLYNYNMDKIPREIYCILDNKKYLFKLDVAVLTLLQKNNSIGHAVTGIICNKNYYIYDSQNNFYFECDWTNLSDPYNTEQILNFFNIYYSKYVPSKIKIKNTSNQFTELYDKSKMNKFKIKCETVIYYNSKLDFSYDDNQCTRKRK